MNPRLFDEFNKALEREFPMGLPQSLNRHVVRRVLRTMFEAGYEHHKAERKA